MKLAAGPATGPADRAVLALHDPERGSLVIATPPPGSPARVLTEILMALYKSVEGKAQTVSVRALRKDADLWLNAYRVHQLIVLHAGALDPEAVEELGDLEYRLRVRLTLLADQRALARVRLTTPNRFEPGLTSLLPGLDPLEPPDPQPTPTVVLPIQPEQFVRRPHRVPFAAGFAMAAAIEPDGRSTASALAGHLRTGLADYVDPRCLGAAAFGTATAIREYGWILRPVRADEVDRDGRLDDPAAFAACVDVLRQFTNPLLTSLGSLSLMGLSEDEMLALLTVDLADDGATIRVGRDVLHVPSSLRPLLRAQYLVVTAPTESTSVPYLGLSATSGRRSLRQDIDAALEDLPAIDSAQVRERAGQDDRWLRRHGLLLERTPGGRRPARTASYDPVKFIDDLRSELASDRTSGITRIDCGCGHPHDVPKRADLPDWPPVVTRSNAAGHPWMTKAEPEREERS
jgi:hypothetical protein